MELKPEQLCCHVSSATLGFEHTGELSGFTGILGQPRATDALEFGLSIDKAGYNIYIGGDDRTGRIRYVRNHLNAIASQQETPSDWLYVNNFDNPMEPRVFSLPPGQGNKLRQDIDGMIAAVLDVFPTCFENPGLQQRKNALQNHYEQVYNDAIAGVKKEAYAKDISMYNDRGTITFTPIVDGKVVDEAEFASLTQDEMDRFNADVAAIDLLLNHALLEQPQWRRNLNDQLRLLQEETIELALKGIFQSLRRAYQSQTGVSIFLAQISAHLPRVIEEHLSESEPLSKHQELEKRKLLESYYHPNILTTAIDGGAPIVTESNPNYQNLFGRVSYGSEELGAAVQQISPGSLHRANGGYLILEVEKLLTGDGTWRSLIRMLRDGLIYLEAPPSEIQVGGSAPLRPESIPLNVKVILIGPREIYYELNKIDRDFNDLFRVLVDFDPYFTSNESNLAQFSGVLHSRAKEAGICELDAAAVARLAEYAHRLAEHQGRLTARIDALIDIAIEADFIRGQAHARMIEAEHIDTAIHSRRHRNARLRDQFLQEILEGKVVISTEGFAVGQINGLSVLQVGESRFGCPTRITATVHPGHRGVVDVEREVELGQSAHSKGVMILTGYLCSFYMQGGPLAISAYIAMEQSYGYIDGDSASLAELCALLSALSGQSLRQDLAVTGSINQLGEVQAVGGVNEKVECFFDLCKARGLSGKEGVILPRSNSDNLMLSERVVEAVANKQFYIYTVDTANEALSLLTGMEVGLADASHSFPRDTLNYKIVSRLKHFMALSQPLLVPDRDKGTL